jgi:sugar/nucleoside kinase (ribokinase family)
MVWDTIHGRGDRSGPVEEWGGIAYALAALEASLPPHWEIVPLIKVGRDLAPKANEFLRALTHRSGAARFIEVPEPNNRVTLRYTSDLRRAEHLSGGVPPWEWHDLEPLVRDLDALYVNFISGFETSLDAIRRIRETFHGPMYVDLHSLFLAVQQDGLRTPQQLPDVGDWFSCFDVVQVNEDELGLIGENPMEVAASAMARGVQLFVVTLAERGAVFFATSHFDFLQARERSRTVSGPIRTARIDPITVEARDPTGCGDVFGGFMVGQLVCGADVESAVRAANAAAARNVQYRGATDLQYHLRGEIVPS